tara:strand:+ start:278 stop:610 length:333 start_codon:yes stop_codon:yes gene_type:complete
MEGFCTPTIILIIIYVIAIFACFVNMYWQPQKDIFITLIIIAIILAYIVCSGAHLLCLNDLHHWAWAIVGVKILSACYVGILNYAWSCEHIDMNMRNCNYLRDMYSYRFY